VKKLVKAAGEYSVIIRILNEQTTFALSHAIGIISGKITRNQYVKIAESRFLILHKLNGVFFVLKLVPTNSTKPTSKQNEYQRSAQTVEKSLILSHLTPILKFFAV
jgi:hypothetical protein